MNTFDVYSFGVIASSTLYLLKDQYPTKSTYTEIEHKYENIGGEAANSSLVLSRLGVTVKLDGNWINPDGDAELIKRIFNQNKIDISRISFQKCQGPKEMLVVDSDSRTVFGTYGQMAIEKSWNFPEEIDIHNAKVICLDPFFDLAALQVVEYAKKLNKPIITVDCKYDDPIFLAANTTIISEEFLRDTYPSHSVSSITEHYRTQSNGTIIFTFGHKEIIYSSQRERFHKFTPYKINPLDTTGAGDSFRAGVIYALLQKWPMEEAIKFSSALAAMVCRTCPGVLNSPSYDEVLSFLEDYGTNE